MAQTSVGKTVLIVFGAWLLAALASVLAGFLTAGMLAMPAFWGGLFFVMVIYRKDRRVAQAIGASVLLYFLVYFITMLAKQ